MTTLVMNRPFPAETTLIALSGKQLAGKDQVARWICEHLSGFQQCPIAQAIKETYAQQHGLTLADIEAHKAQHRPGLIALGDWGRAQDADYWLHAVLNKPRPLVVSDVRLPREYTLLREAGAYCIRVEASREVRVSRGALTAEDDPTETALDKVNDWDAVVVNEGSPEELADVLRDLFF